MGGGEGTASRVSSKEKVRTEITNSFAENSAAEISRELGQMITKWGRERKMTFKNKRGQGEMTACFFVDRNDPTKRED